MPPPLPGPPRCLGCGYALEALPSPGKCPECGREFDAEDAATYTTKPPFVRWRYWLPGCCLAAGVGITVGVVLAAASGSVGAGVWFAMSYAVGALVAYGTRGGKGLGWLMLGALFVAFLVGACSADFVAFALVMGVALAFLTPLALGAGMGWNLRGVMKRSAFGQREHLP